jgi:hypothetical protein
MTEHEMNEQRYRVALAVIAGLCEAALRPMCGKPKKAQLLYYIQRIEANAIKAMPHLKPEVSK